MTAIQWPPHADLISTPVYCTTYRAFNCRTGRLKLHEFGWFLPVHYLKFHNDQCCCLPCPIPVQLCIHCSEHQQLSACGYTSLQHIMFCHGCTRLHPEDAAVLRQTASHPCLHSQRVFGKSIISPVIIIIEWCPIQKGSYISGCLGWEITMASQNITLSYRTYFCQAQQFRIC